MLGEFPGFGVGERLNVCQAFTLLGVVQSKRANAFLILERGLAITMDKNANSGVLVFVGRRAVGYRHVLNGTAWRRRPPDSPHRRRLRRE